MKYAHRKYLITVMEAESDGVLHNEFGKMDVRKGEQIASDYDGNQFVITDDYFRENFVPVESKKKEKPMNTLSPFEEQYYKNAYEEMANLDQTEDDEYINKTKQLFNDKPL